LSSPKTQPYDLGLLLIAEDNLADVGLIRMALETHGLSANVHLVRDGEDAVRFVEQVEADPLAPCPSLAVLDLNLPRIRGDQILRRLRSSSRWRDVPVIVMSSSLSAHDRTDAMRLGATSYFTKPSDLEHFLELGALIKKVSKAKRSSNSKE
jgi:CheY-like chemotaxis protein